MNESNDIIDLLREIRDINREHLADYRAAAKRSIELQQQAVGRAESVSKLYRIALAVSAVLISAIIILVIYLMTYLGRR
jgi:hypothetical protein